MTWAVQLTGVTYHRSRLTDQLPVAVISAVTGVSRASSLVTDIQDGYLDRLLLTPVRRGTLLLGLMTADFMLIVTLAVPVLVLGLVLGISVPTGLLGMLVFIHAWYVFLAGQFDPKGHVLILPAGLRLLNDILLVIILLELFRTVVRFLQTEVLELEPYLSVGVIACTRKILTASAELSHQQNMTETQFYQYLMDVGLNVTVIIALIGAVFMIRQRPQPSPPPVAAPARAGQ